MRRLLVRVDIGEGARLGPGKIELLEHIRDTGSISAAGRMMRMSYKRAWLLVDSLNQAFRRPVVVAQHGGKAGGGAALTPFGAELVARYRRVEADALRSFERHLGALEADLNAAATAPARAAAPARRR
ncbi:MAG: LysR family transcriptional regulator [Rhodospirillaceae bacterium]|nr:LysR family transcriptional regulator [Rhodospirillaceae bacterium]